MSPFDILVVGGGASGIGAAVSAAREGKKALLLSEYKNLGGMITNGISNTDIGIAPLNGISNFPNKEWCDPEKLSNGLFEEFRQLVKRHYRNDPKSANGLRYEPKIAQRFIHQLVNAEANITVELEATFENIHITNDKISSLTFRRANGNSETISLDPNTFVIDATDCGDVAAACGCPFFIGREGKTVTNEIFAGKIYWDQYAADRENRYRFLKTSTAQTTHRGDSRVQAYSYLMTIKDYGRRAPNIISRPPGYRRDKYDNGIPFFDTWAYKNGYMPNQKYEVNVHPKGSDLQEINYNYHTGNRAAIEAEYKNHALGYLYYIQHDLGLDHFGLANDEYTDNNNFPYRLYVRESRRIQGKYIFNEADATPFRIIESSNGNLSGQYKTYDGNVTKRPPAHSDGIALVSYAMDSHAVRAYPQYRANNSNYRHLGEGEFYISSLTGPGSVPFGVLLPDQGPTNLLVSHAVSATHVGYGTLRMEPIRMWMGQAAGCAASLAIDENLDLKNLNIRELQKKLIAPPHNLKLFYYVDVNEVPWAHVAIQILSLMGVFYGYDRYEFRPAQLMTRAEFIKIVLLAAELAETLPPNPIITYPGYADVNESDWFYPIVKQAYESGILTLFQNEQNLQPNLPITRAQAATLILDALNIPVENFTGTPTFVDVQLNPDGTKPWYFDVIETINKKEIMRGDNANNPDPFRRTFRPNDNLNRAETAVTLLRAIEVGS